jgi:hypothetical protein
MLEDHLDDQQMGVGVRIVSCSKHPLVSFETVAQIQFSSKESMNIIISIIITLLSLFPCKQFLLQMLTAQVEEDVLGSFLLVYIFVSLHQPKQVPDRKKILFIKQLLDKSEIPLQHTVLGSNAIMK